MVAAARADASVENGRPAGTRDDRCGSAADRGSRAAGDARDIAALEAALTDRATQRDGLGDDGAWRDAGEPVGSGLVEREVALVINRRLQRHGMRWRRANADALVARRARTIHDTGDQRPASHPLLAGTQERLEVVAFVVRGDNEERSQEALDP